MTGSKTTAPKSVSRHRDTVARAWRAQVRLCGRFRRLDERKTNRNTVVIAIARELAGFTWAEMIA